MMIVNIHGGGADCGGYGPGFVPYCCGFCGNGGTFGSDPEADSKTAVINIK